MQLLRIPPYKSTLVLDVPGTSECTYSFKNMAGSWYADISGVVTPNSDKQISIPLSEDIFKYDAELSLTVSQGSSIVIKENVSVERPYSRSASTVASDISAYLKSEKLARMIIDSVVPEGFYLKKTTLQMRGNGTDYLPFWDNVVNILTVKENNILIYDSSLETNQKTFRVENGNLIVAYDGAQVNRYESKPITIPMAPTDNLDGQIINYSGVDFPQSYDYVIEAEIGYLSVPSDIQQASELLVHDIDCGKLDYYKRYITSYNTDQFKIQFDKSMLEGTGNILVDKILARYDLRLNKIGVL